MEETQRNSSHVVIDARDGFFHAMLSYRVNTDAELVAKIHDKLHLLAPNAGKSMSHVNQLLDSPFPEGFKRDDSTLNSSLHVFLDAYCLKDGVGWEGDGSTKSGGFVGAVRLSPVFVPVFSAVEVVTESTELARKGSGKGSVGQMINLAHKDMQDNVLLELIVARELHLMAKTSIKTNGKNVLAPCSYIFPLFRQDVWKCGAASSLPKTASAITNAKAKHVLKQMDIPNEAISTELRDETLTVHAVFEFFTQFQGIKLYDRGEERFQVAAAANAIISVVDEVRSIVADSKFYDLNMNSSQMNELSGFMSQLNMSNYTAILAIHHVSNVFQLAELKQSRADAIVHSIAEYGVRASEKSMLPIELSKVGSAIHAAQSSPLAKPLNDRFRNFIDRDASFVTMLSSSSLFDIFLSKKLAVLFLFLFSSIWLMILNYSETVLQILEVIPRIIIMLACCVSVFHSPRSGRYTLACAFFVWTLIFFAQFAVSAHSAIFDNCSRCTYPAPSNLPIVQKILIQQTNWITFSGLLFCTLFKQQHTVLVVFVLQLVQLLICIVMNAIIGWSVLYPIFYIFIGPATWLFVVVAMQILLYIGNKRAMSFYELNSADVKMAYAALHKNAKGSLFGNLCPSPSSEPQPTQSLSFGTFARKQQNPERAEASEIPMHPMHAHLVVCVSESDQHLTSNSDENQREAEAQLLAQRNSANQTKPSGKSPKNISIQDMFKTERTLQGEVLQRQRSFEILIRDAEFINDAFQYWVSSWLSGGPDLHAVEKYFYLAPKHAATQPNYAQQTPPQTDGDVETNVQIDQCFRNLSCNPTNPASRDDLIKGIRIRGPLKHVDRAIAKVSALFYNFNIVLQCQDFLDFVWFRVLDRRFAQIL